jgi:hypothetical protein
MDHELHICRLENAINRCKRVEPFTNGVLPPDMRLMAALYGQMIYCRKEHVEFESLSVLLKAVLVRWLPPDDSAIEEVSEVLCGLRRDVGGGEDCESCQ